MEETQKKMPVVTTNVHGISVAIWNNKNDKGDEYQTVSFGISQKDKDNEGKFKKRTIIYPTDLENILAAYADIKAKADAAGIQTKFIPKKQ